MAMFSKGKNSKLSKDVAIFNLPAIKTCPNSETCRDTCYARQAEECYKECRVQRESNYTTAKQATKTEFFEYIMNELDKNKAKIVRLHESGDFFNDEYIGKWLMIIKENPNIQFYGYTKVKNALILNEFKNCNIIYSFVNGLRNYGTQMYCNALNLAYNAFICPHENQKHFCMGECKECLTRDKVCFVIHGNRAKKDTYETRAERYLPIGD